MLQKSGLGGNVRGDGATMRVLILGATGRIGRLAVDRALMAGHDVVAVVREPDRVEPRDRLEVRAGSVTDSPVLDDAAAGVDAVIAAVGPRSNTADDEMALETGMRHLVAAMEGRGVSRLVALSGAGVDVAGDRKPLPDRLMSRVVRVFAHHIVGAKQREFAVFASTSLDWTALRPPFVVDGEPVGYRLDRALSPGARVRRADVAQALVDQLTAADFIRSAPFVMPPKADG